MFTMILLCPLIVNVDARPRRRHRQLQRKLPQEARTKKPLLQRSKRQPPKSQHLQRPPPFRRQSTRPKKRMEVQRAALRTRRRKRRAELLPRRRQQPLPNPLQRRRYLLISLQCVLHLRSRRLLKRKHEDENRRRSSRLLDPGGTYLCYRAMLILQAI